MASTYYKINFEIDQGYTLEKLKIFFRKFYGRYNDLLYNITI